MDLLDVLDGYAERLRQHAVDKRQAVKVQKRLTAENKQMRSQLQGIRAWAKVVKKGTR